MNTSVGNGPSSGWETAAYAIVLVLGLGSIIGAWTFGLLIPAILLTILYGVLRDVQRLNRLRTSDESAGSARQDRAVSNERPAQSSATRT